MRPVLDRIDIQVEMPQLSYEEISSAKKGEPSSAVLERIMKAREIQQKRFAGTEIRSNSKIPPSYLHEMCPMDENAKQMLSDYRQGHTTGYLKSHVPALTLQEAR